MFNANKTFINTLTYTRDGEENIRQSVTAKEGGMLPTRVGNILGVSGGTIYDDFVTFSEKALSEPSNVTYAFTYDKDMCIGSIIKLNLPMWTGDASAVTIVSGCGSSGFDLQDVNVCKDSRFTSETACIQQGTWTSGACTITAGGRETSGELCTAPTSIWYKQVKLTVHSRTLVRNTPCRLSVTGLQTPASPISKSIYPITQAFDLSSCTKWGILQKKSLQWMK